MSIYQRISFRAPLKYRTINISRDGGYCEGKFEKLKRTIRFNCDNIFIAGEKMIDLAAEIHVFVSNGNRRQEILSELLNKRMDMAGYQKEGASGEMYFYPPDAIICNLPVPETDFFSIIELSNSGRIEIEFGALAIDLRKDCDFGLSDMEKIKYSEDPIPITSWQFIHSIKYTENIK